MPALEAVAANVGIPISVDTYKAQVARQAVECGAALINDVWGLKADPEMARAAAETGAALVLMHNQIDRSYGDLLGEVSGSLCGQRGRGRRGRRRPRPRSSWTPASDSARRPTTIWKSWAG